MRRTNHKRPIGPITINQRIVSLDIIRGFALIGILFVNIMSFSGISALGAGNEFTDTSLNWFIQFFLRGKFLSLFAILFGLGFAMQMYRFQATGRRIEIYIRRMLFFIHFWGTALTFRSRRSAQLVCHLSSSFITVTQITR
jgi:uncharacterized protein